MRVRLAAILTLPLVVGGSLAAHQVAYALVAPAGAARAALLARTGHGYLEALPLLGALLLLLVVGATALAAHRAARGDELAPVPAWPFALAAPLGFALQEHLERVVHGGALPWGALLAPTFVPGLLLQVPFALVAWAIARLILRTADGTGRAVARRATSSWQGLASCAGGDWARPPLPLPPPHVAIWHGGRAPPRIS